MKKRYKTFIAVLIVWTISLLSVCLPTSKWMPLTFPFTINSQILALFIASTGISSSASLYLGLDILKAKP